MADKQYTSQGAPVQVPSSNSTVTLLSANPKRVMFIIFNDSTQVLYVNYGGGASSTNYVVQIASNGYYEAPVPVYSGVVTGVWAAANGNGYVTELT